MNILISGASGFLGTALKSYLKEQGHTVFCLTREANDNSIFWDPYSKIISIESIPHTDCVINLSGDNISSGYWTYKKKNKILESRIKTTDFLVETIKRLSHKPKILLSASAIGFYKETLNSIDEKGESGETFLSHVCKSWEASANKLISENVRVVNLRFGVILSKKGGAFPKMSLPFKFGLGAIFGDGSQHMSWISLNDTIRAINHIISNNNISGPVNITNENPLSNKDFSSTLAKHYNRPLFLKIPGFILKLTLRDLAQELFLKNANILPQELIKSGFIFNDNNLEELLRTNF